MYSSVSKDKSRREAVSALFDEELSTQEAQLIQETIQADGKLKHFHNKIQVLNTGFQSFAPDDAAVKQAQDTVLEHVRRTIRVRPTQIPWWQQSLSLPAPLVAAATVVFVLSVGVFLSQSPLFEAHEIRSASSSLSEFDIGSRNVNVQVNIDSANTDQLLQWLNNQVDTQQVTIQLPDQALFQLRGEPVMLRPELDSESLRIIPMEDYEE